uniref:Uncharacterized protein n=1 Tax=Romanomermis culicivorax TaxID=13658 RepID=A0A915I0L5_ROMCU
MFQNRKIDFPASQNVNIPKKFPGVSRGIQDLTIDFSYSCSGSTSDCSSISSDNPHLCELKERIDIVERYDKSMDYDGKGRCGSASGSSCASHSGAKIFSFI